MSYFKQVPGQNVLVQEEHEVLSFYKNIFMSLQVYLTELKKDQLAIKFLIS